MSPTGKKFATVSLSCDLANDCLVLRRAEAYRIREHGLDCLDFIGAVLNGT